MMQWACTYSPWKFIMDDSHSPEALCLYAQNSHFLLSSLTLGLEKKGKYLTPSPPLISRPMAGQVPA